MITPGDEKRFFKIVKAGFSSKRKKLRSSLSAGLSMSKPEIESMLKQVGINPDDRAEALAINQWIDLMKIVG